MTIGIESIGTADELPAMSQSVSDLSVGAVRHNENDDDDDEELATAALGEDEEAVTNQEARLVGVGWRRLRGGWRDKSFDNGDEEGNNNDGDDDKGDDNDGENGGK